MREKDIMFECNHPFLVNLEFLFQNEERLYFVMPFVRGGELYKVFTAQKRFSEEQTLFFCRLVDCGDWLLALERDRA